MVTSTLPIRTLLRITAWAAVAAAIVWWPTRPAGFSARWVSLPPAMSWEMLITARQAAERPTGMTYTLLQISKLQAQLTAMCGRLAIDCQR